MIRQFSRPDQYLILFINSLSLIIDFMFAYCIIAFKYIDYKLA